MVVEQACQATALALFGLRQFSRQRADQFRALLCDRRAFGDSLLQSVVQGPQGLFDLFALRNVLDHVNAELRLARRVALDRHFPVDPESAAILVRPPLLEGVTGDLATDQAPKLLPVAVAVLGDGKSIEGLLDQLFTAVTDNLA